MSEIWALIQDAHNLREINMHVNNYSTLKYVSFLKNHLFIRKAIPGREREEERENLSNLPFQIATTT